jgi:hypothetical protein
VRWHRKELANAAHKLGTFWFAAEAGGYTLTLARRTGQ